MDKQTKLWLGIAAAVVAYFIFKPKLSTSSPASDKMKLTCAQGEKLGDDGQCYSIGGVLKTTSEVQVVDDILDIPKSPTDGFKNYVDTKTNIFFQPEVGYFNKKG